MKEAEKAFFRPLWRRAALLATALIWGVIELAAGNDPWALMALGVSAYIVWAYFIRFD